MQAIQRKNPFLRFVTESLYDPHALNFWLKKINPLWSTSEPMGRIIAKQQISSDIVQIRLHCNRHVQFGRAGQHHPITIELKGRRYTRTYSLTQIDEQHLDIHVKKITGGVVSTWLCEHAKIGDMIYLDQPFGEVCIENFLSSELVFLAAGSGITPIYSMLKSLHRTEKLPEYRIQIFYWAQHQKDFAFREQLDQWQAQYPNLVVNYFCTQEAPFDQRLNEKQITHLSNVEKQSVFACGPFGFVNEAKRLLCEAQQIQFEAFSLVPLTYDEADTQQINITLTKSNRIVSIPKGQPILLGLEQQNINPTHGCRMGICNKCSCNKVSGATKNLNDQSENIEPNNLLRICVNSAQNDLVLDL